MLRARRASGAGPPCRAWPCGPCLAPGPACAAQLGPARARRSRRRRTSSAPDPGARPRQEQRLRLGVLDLHELALRALAHGDALSALEVAILSSPPRSRRAPRRRRAWRSRRSERKASEGLRRRGRGRRSSPNIPPRRRRPARARLPKAEAGGDLGPESHYRPRPPLRGDVEAVLQREPPQLLHASGRTGGHENTSSSSSSPDSSALIKSAAASAARPARPAIPSAGRRRTFLRLPSPLPAGSF